MRLSGKVHHGARFVLGEQRIDKSRVTDIASNEDMAWISLKRGKILKVASVGELVEIDDGGRLRLDPIKDEVRADETGTAGDKNGVFHKFRNHEISRIHTNGESGRDSLREWSGENKKLRKRACMGFVLTRIHPGLPGRLLFI